MPRGFLYGGPPHPGEGRVRRYVPHIGSEPFFGSSGANLYCWGLNVAQATCLRSHRVLEKEPIPRPPSRVLKVSARHGWYIVGPFPPGAFFEDVSPPLPPGRQEGGLVGRVCRRTICIKIAGAGAGGRVYCYPFVIFVSYGNREWGGNRDLGHPPPPPRIKGVTYPLLLPPPTLLFSLRGCTYFSSTVLAHGDWCGSTFFDQKQGLCLATLLFLNSASFFSFSQWNIPFKSGKAPILLPSFLLQKILIERTRRQIPVKVK